MSTTRYSQPLRSNSGDSSKSAGGSDRDHELSVNFYSRENGHWSTYMRRQGAATGTIHHVRSDTVRDQDRFYYHEGPQPYESPSLYGSSVVARLSSGEVSKAQASIRDYAGDEDNIPRVSRRTNCQNFVGGALGRLERDGLLKEGHSQYFAQHYGRRGEDIGTDLKRDGRHFELAEKKIYDGPPAARYGEETTRRAPKKLDMKAFAHLSR
ncbi:hypothetical protein GGS26DRAFT_439746 [Hypomontagnella submonticulosa]|nr:hypothetical protein GGS26DRAFT_439746 [Hypomontagnella submonticulosa]